MVIAGERDIELVKISSSYSYHIYCQPFAALDDFDDFESSLLGRRPSQSDIASRHVSRHAR